MSFPSHIIANYSLDTTTDKVITPQSYSHKQGFGFGKTLFLSLVFFFIIMKSLDELNSGGLLRSSIKTQ